MILIIYGSSIILKKHQSKVIKKIDENNITPGDFAIMVSNLPKDKTEVDVKAWIKSNLNGAEIEDISIAYDIKEIVGMINKVDKLKRILLNPRKHSK